MRSDKKTSWPEMTAEYLRSIMDYDPLTGIMRWRCNRGGKALAGKEAGRTRPRDGYRHVKIDRKMYLVHRLAWLYVYGKWPVGFLDHENTVPDANWIDNLREATRTQNGANRRSQANNQVGVKGVHMVQWSGGAVRYKAQIYITRDGVKVGEYLGCYETKEEAGEVYAHRAVEIFGEFARVA